MLNEIPSPSAVLSRMLQKLAHHVKLMVARENLRSLFLAGLRIFLFNDLRVIFQDIRKPARRKNAQPEIIGLQAATVRRIPRTVGPPLMVVKKPRTFAFAVRTK